MRNCFARARLLGLAGLVHDLGKISQPTGETLPNGIESLEQQFCPTDPKTHRPTHRHVLYSAAFLDEAKNDFGGLDRHSELLRLACSHHRPDPDAFDQYLLVKADWLASGHDRRPDFTEDAPITGLRPSLGAVSWPQTAPTHDAYVQSRILDFSEDAHLPVPTQNYADYQSQCRILSDEVRNVLKTPFRDADDCLERLSHALARVAHAVPSSRSRQQAADVSLFDHSRLVAAFASCLAIQHQDGPCNARKISGQYRLLGLSLGGIQSFLFRFVPPMDSAPGQTGERGVAKSLRARSFFVSIATWLAARRILVDCDLSAVHQIFDAGGRTVLLLPDDPEVCQRARMSLRQLEHEIHKLTGGILRFDYNFSSRLTDSDFQSDKFATTYAEFDRLLTAARFSVPSRLQSGSSWNESAWVSESVSLEMDRGEFAFGLRRIGAILPKTRYVVLNSDDNRDALAQLTLFGQRLSFCDHRPSDGLAFEILPARQASAPDRFLLIANHIPVADDQALNRLTFFDSEAPKQEVDESDDEMPRIGRHLTFEHLAHLSTNRIGEPVRKPMLAAIKADVDHLGMLLTNGLGDKASFGRFASVARSLDSFFKGFLTQKLREEFPYIYTVFSGGDDLFLIGPWLDIIRFTTELHQSFQRATCDNQNLTFSAGIVLCQPSTPVRSITALADDALEQAKESGRDRITLGSVVTSWSRFCKGVSRHETLVELVKRRDSNADKLNPSLIYRLLTYSKQALVCARTPKLAKPQDWKWRSQLNYDLRRNVPAQFEKQSAVGAFRDWILQIQHPEDAAELYVAALLALYCLRGT